MPALSATTSTATATAQQGFLEDPAPAYLTILDPEIDRTPSVLMVVLAGFAPDATITFRVGDVVLDQTLVADDSGEIALPSSLDIDDRIGEGSHTLVAETADHFAMATFAVLRDPPTSPVARVPDADPVFVPEAVGENGVHRWVWQDAKPGGLGSWVMPINPTTMSNPHVRKTVSETHTTAVNGRSHIYEAQPSLEWEFSGYCPDFRFYEKMLGYSEINRRFYIIDHRNRAWIVTVEHFDLQARKRQRDDAGKWNDWAGDYTVRVVLYDQTPKVPVGS